MAAYLSQDLRLRVIMAAMHRTPDVTLAELQQRPLSERGETFAISTRHEFFRRHRITDRKRIGVGHRHGPGGVFT